MRAFLSLCVIVLAAAAGAEPQPFEILLPPPPDGWIADRAAEAGVDDATVARIRAIAVEERAAQLPLMSRLQEKKRALREKLGGESPDERSVERIARDLGELETELEVLRLKSMLSVRRLLTPEQNSALLAGMQRRFVDRRVLLGETFAACDAEIAEHCGGADGPPHLKIGCLLHKPGVEVSPACKEALAKIPPPPGAPGAPPHLRPPHGFGPTPGDAPAFAPR